MFKDKFQFSREKFEYIYSIAVLVAIPILMVANTLWLVVTVRNNFDQELTFKSNLAAEVISTSVQQNLIFPSVVQSQIDAIKQNTDELQEITVVQPTSDGTYNVIASTDKATQNQTIKDDVLFSVASTKQKSIAQEVTPQNGPRYWEVVNPIVVQGKTKAIVSTAVSTAIVDTMISNTLIKSIVIVGITVVIIILLLFNHFRFVEYAMLFRKMKEVDQLKNDFLSVATHELRAPMTVIKGNIANIMEDNSDKLEDMVKQSLHTMYEETERLNSLINDLLNVSRIEQGRVSYELAVIDCRDIISQVVDEFKQKAADKGLDLQYQKPEQPLMISVDKGRLTEIMTNLTDNAIKYSRKGTVTISHKPADGKTRISVRDTGIGISAAARERLFSRFYRVRTAETKDIPGTGLGLWIIKQYIEHMSGTINVDSLEGVGTEFIIEFPLAKY